MDYDHKTKDTLQQNDNDLFGPTASSLSRNVEHLEQDLEQDLIKTGQ